MTIDDVINKCDEAESIMIDVIRDKAAIDKDRSYSSDFKFMNMKLKEISSLIDDLRTRRDRKPFAIDRDIEAMFQ